MATVSENTPQLLFEWATDYLKARGWHRARNGTNLWRKGKVSMPWLSFGDAFVIQLDDDNVNFSGTDEDRKAH